MITDLPNQKEANMEHIQMLYNVISILTEKLGGKVELTRHEIQNPPDTTYARVDDPSTDVAVRLEVRHEP